MTFRKHDDAIPTLTEQVQAADDDSHQKAARFLTRVQSSRGTMPAWPERPVRPAGYAGSAGLLGADADEVPTLTTTVPTPSVIPLASGPDMADVVLAGALQADIEEAVQEALDEAMHLVKMRLEARIPALVSQAIRRTRAG